MEHVGTQPVKTNTWNTAAFRTELWTALKTVLSKVHVQKKHRALRIQETLALGDRRFLAVVQWDNQKLLVGVTPQNITLLEPLRSSKDYPRASAVEEEHST